MVRMRLCERCGTPVDQKRIGCPSGFSRPPRSTPRNCCAFEDTRLAGSGSRLLQTNWIGRSGGRRAWSSRPKMATRWRSSPPGRIHLWGATFMVLAPEHPLVDKVVTTEEQRARPWRTISRRGCQAYRSGHRTRGRSTKRRPGCSPAAIAVNPVNQATHPDLDRRLRDDDVVRHRGDHGRTGS